MRRILIYGGRDFGILEADTTFKINDFIGYDAEAALAIVSVMVNKVKVRKRDTVVSGMASGADTLGEMCAKPFNLEIDQFPAQWTKYGRSAGPRRNVQMLASGIDVAIKCPGGRGTAHMTKLLEEAGVPIHEVSL